MASGRQTRNQEETRKWGLGHGGHPAQVEGTEAMLRTDFGKPDGRLDRIDWDRFFTIFGERNIEFLSIPEGHMNKFVRSGG